MKAKPLTLRPGGWDFCAPDVATHVMLRMPGPLPTRILPVILHGQRDGTPCWSWNGSTEKPTLRPSILTQGPPHRCHSFVADGRVQFLADCSHEHAGQTLDLLDVE